MSTDHRPVTGDYCALNSAFIYTYRFKPVVLFIMLLLFTGSLLAQQQDTAQVLHTGVAKIDSIKDNMVFRLQELGKSLKKKSVDEYTAEKVAMRQDQVFEMSRRIMEKAKNYLKAGIDTAAMRQELIKINHWITIADDGIFINAGAAHSYRNLVTTYNLLLVLQQKAVALKTIVDRHHNNLVSFQYQMDSLSTDSSIFTFPDDSVSIVAYIKKLTSVAKGMKPIDSALDRAHANIEDLQIPLNTTVYSIDARLEAIDGYEHSISERSFSADFPGLFDKAGYSRPFSEIFRYSKEKGSLTFRFYLQNNSAGIAIVLLLLIALAVYLRSLKKIYREKKLLSDTFDGQLVLRYPFCSAIVIVLSLFQFIFPVPPFIFNVIFWVFSSIALTIIFSGFITKFWMRFWLTIFVLFFAACIDNTALQASRVERWFMFVLALAGVITGVYTLAKGHRDELREKWIVYAIGFMVFLEFVSIVANITGRYNLSKTMLTSGYFNVIIAILFLWTVRLINEGLALAFAVYSGQERKSFYINFKKIGTRAHPLFYFFLVIGWFILFGRNFYAFKLLTNPIQTFLAEERSVGSYTFTINNLLVFVFIMALSVIISKVVSFFASDRYPDVTGNQKEGKVGIGSWILLVRISIITIGVLFAFAAAGIPLDKIAIILGALGVGIGFGLQTLVNNLVSGLIIAFEKPVNVGDIVEIGGQGGTMKSIGFRSSIISTWDGADMVMPNGDLLNAHLVNWTLGGGKRRMNILVGVSYNTNLQQARDLLTDILSKDERVLSYPAPSVMFETLNNSSIDIKIFFWVRHMREGILIKSDVIAAISRSFKENNIEIPFPQQEVHIHTIQEKKE
ncbi:MAG: mechanosensitive ion channel [Filimonas sp.]|nr:mechanosensitive ion channel [Filimonas sp.]